jgi:DNA-binding NarL/FixJ family response regulator
MIKLLMADDHTVVREGLKQIVADTNDIVVTGEASDGREVLAKVSKEDYDVVILDISMPGPGGLEILKQLKRENPELPILILSIYPEEQYATRALKAGASGYLTKESAPDELIMAIQTAYNGKKYVSSFLAEKLAHDLEIDTEILRHEKLSDREFQIMIMISEGKRLKDIAMELYLSDKTITTYRSRILEKMRMKNNSELTRYAIENNLIE